MRFPLTQAVAFSSVLLVGGSVAAVLRHDRDVLPAQRIGAEAARVDSTPAPVWAANPTERAPNLPPAGRSLFDFLVAKSVNGATSYDIPYPIESLLDRIDERAGCSAKTETCTRKVLIPLGRSLQRTAASQRGFFETPRLVVAVDREPATEREGQLLLKDRLFIGYHEASNLIEVISYNETAGRFEFQLVRNYRPGATPELVYANRAICQSCHQNQAPLFSRNQWDETNANPRIGQQLAAAHASFYGVAARGAISEPNAIDAATDDANRLAATQRLWWEACGERATDAARCRSAALWAALQYRLSGERGFETRGAFEDVLSPAVARNAKAHWPLGLAIPNPDLPNRDPFTFTTGTTGLAAVDVHAGLEPLLPRAPIEVWQPSDPLARRLVRGIGDWLSAAEVHALDRDLSRFAALGSPATEVFASTCKLTRAAEELRFTCPAVAEPATTALQGRLNALVHGEDSGAVDLLTVPGQDPLRMLEVTQLRRQQRPDGTHWSFAPKAGSLSARLPDGRAITQIELQERTGRDTATVSIAAVDDVQPLRVALDSLAANGGLQSATLDRERVYAAISRALGQPPRVSSAPSADQLPAARADSALPTIEDLPPDAKPFHGRCAGCHAGPDRSPPNFLHGSNARVQAAITACAPRIFVRLGMWQLPPAGRAKTPMPPARARLEHDGSIQEQGPSLEQVQQLQAAAAQLVRATTGSAPEVSNLLAHGYEDIPPCLPQGM
jgi:hypothetical protein